MKNKKLSVFVLGALLLGAGGSIAAQSFAQAPSQAQPSQVVTGQTDQTIDQKDAQDNDIEVSDREESKVTSPVTISESQANKIASDANSGTKVLETSLEQHNGKAIYEISLSNQMEVKIDANTGTILKSHIEKEDGQDKHIDQKDAQGNDIEVNDGNE